MELLSVRAVAQELGLTTTSIYNYIDRNILRPDVTVTTDEAIHHRFTRKTVDEFRRSCTTGKVKKGERLYCSGEAAVMLKMGQSTFNDHVRRGNITPDFILPPPKNGKCGRRMFTAATLMAFKASYSYYGRVRNERGENAQSKGSS